MKKKILSFIMATTIICTMPYTIIAAENKEVSNYIITTTTLPGEKYEFIDATGALRAEDGLIPMKKTDSSGIKCGYIDTNGNIAIPFIYDSASYFSDGMAKVRKGSMEGFINTDVEMMIEQSRLEAPMYARHFIQGVISANYVPGDRTTILMDKTGNAIVPRGKYDSMNTTMMTFLHSASLDPRYYPADSLFYIPVSNEGKWGYIDKAGNEVIPLQYGDARPFHEGLAAVGGKSIPDKQWGYKTDTYGFIDATGKFVIPTIYRGVEDFLNGTAIVNNADGKFGVVDKNGNIIIPVEYAKITRTYGINSEDYFMAEGSMYDSAGKELVSTNMYEGFGMVKDDTVAALTDKGWGVVDLKTGNEIIPAENFLVSGFSDGLCAVMKKKDDPVGYVNMQNEYVIQPQYEPWYTFNFNEPNIDFSGPLIDTVLSGRVGAINRAGDVVIPFEYDSISHLSNGFYIINKGRKLNGIADKDGTILIPPMYAGIHRIQQVGTETDSMVFAGLSSDYNTYTIIKITPKTS